MTVGLRMLLLKQFQSISSGVYLHIRQPLLAPTAVSLNGDITIVKAKQGYLSLRHSLYEKHCSTKIIIVKHFLKSGKISSECRQCQRNPMIALLLFGVSYALKITERVTKQ